LKYSHEKKLFGGVLWLEGESGACVRIRYFSGVFLKLAIKAAKKKLARIELAIASA